LGMRSTFCSNIRKEEKILTLPEKKTKMKTGTGSWTTGKRKNQRGKKKKTP